MQLSVVNSNLCFGHYDLNKPYIGNSLFPKKNLFPPKKLVFSVLKKQKPLIVKSSVEYLAKTCDELADQMFQSLASFESSIKDSIKTSAAFTNKMFQSLASFDRWVLQSLSNLIPFKPKASILFSGFCEEGDLIQLNHDGNLIIGVVQHIGFLETTLIGPVGLVILQNFKIDKYSIENKTDMVANEKWFGFGFNTLLSCKTKEPFKFMKEIISVLEKNEITKDNDEHNVVVELPNNKIRVVCYVNSSKLQIPLFKSYLEVSEQVFADIDKNLYKNKTVADYLRFW
ncbi:hypothetical protein MKW94_016144 [Papaver nudicaule]|uniref:Uncharacterized protein n=1 Tax=Papaver nudicaule TaxID=74823 RepID=A0AA41S0L0_PAPNU|nr:hypothetical protein [Papaver nudicaule]